MGPPSECSVWFHFDIDAHSRMAWAPSHRHHKPSCPTWEWKYGKSCAFPHIPTPQRRLRTNVQVQKTDQVTATDPVDLLTRAGHVVVPVHERALRVIAPGPNVELEE